MYNRKLICSSFTSTEHDLPHPVLLWFKLKIAMCVITCKTEHQFPKREGNATGAVCLVLLPRLEISNLMRFYAILNWDIAFLWCDFLTLMSHTCHCRSCGMFLSSQTVSDQRYKQRHQKSTVANEKCVHLRSLKLRQEWNVIRGIARPHREIEIDASFPPSQRLNNFFTPTHQARNQQKFRHVIFFIRHVSAAAWELRPIFIRHEIRIMRKVFCLLLYFSVLCRFRCRSRRSGERQMGWDDICVCRRFIFVGSSSKEKEKVYVVSEWKVSLRCQQCITIDCVTVGSCKTSFSKSSQDDAEVDSMVGKSFPSVHHSDELSYDRAASAHPLV